MSEEWWRETIPKTEKVLWVGKPSNGFFPPHVGWAYSILILCLGLAWLASPWFAESVRDYWKLGGCTVLLSFFIWLDRFIRSRRVYVVTTRNAWWISEVFKPKHMSIDKTLKYHRSGRNVVFSRSLFLVFEYLSDPEAALQALDQAREAAQ